MKKTMTIYIEEETLKLLDNIGSISGGIGVGQVISNIVEEYYEVNVSDSSSVEKLIEAVYKERQEKIQKELTTKENFLSFLRDKKRILSLAKAKEEDIDWEKNPRFFYIGKDETSTDEYFRNPHLVSENYLSKYLLKRAKKDEAFKELLKSLHFKTLVYPYKPSERRAYIFADVAFQLNQ